MQELGLKAYVAEFIGAFVLIMAIAWAATLFGGVPALIGFLIIGLVIAFTLAMLVLTLGGVSGGHFNPAVTTSMMAIRKIRPIDGLIYILLQLAGGVLAVLVVKLILNDPGGEVDYGATAVNSEVINTLQGFLIEIIGTFLLVFAITGVAVNTRAPRDWAAWAIGSALGVAVILGGPLTGGGFNPARWFGPALVSGAWDDGWIYVFGPVIGGGLAALLYRFFFLEEGEDHDTEFKEEVGAPSSPGLGHEPKPKPKPDDDGGAAEAGPKPAT